MAEQTKARRRAGFDSSDDAGGFAPCTTGAPVTVSHGPYTERLPVGNMSVGEIRARFRDRFDIDPQSHAVIDGEDASDDTTVKPGQLLMFMRRAGEKGTARHGTRGPRRPGAGR